jgi:hypothetical protein
MNVNQLSVEGVWSLLSFEKEGPQGVPVFPFGKNAKGMLTYTGDGYIFASLMDGDREKLGVNMEVLATPGFKNFGKRLNYAKATARSLSYAGRYAVQGSEIWHDVTVCSFPDWVGTRLLRKFYFEGETLILTFTDTLGVASKLAWRRASK